jgi:hypothetical protein
MEQTKVTTSKEVVKKETFVKDFFNEDYDYVSYRLTDRYFDETKQDIDYIDSSIFAGCFAIKDGKIIPLDGDVYDEDEEVLYFEKWVYPEEGITNGLTIVVKTEWYRNGVNGLEKVE